MPTTQACDALAMPVRREGAERPWSVADGDGHPTGERIGPGPQDHRRGGRRPAPTADRRPPLRRLGSSGRCHQPDHQPRGAGDEPPHARAGAALLSSIASSVHQVVTEVTGCGHHLGATRGSGDAFGGEPGGDLSPTAASPICGDLLGVGGAAGLAPAAVAIGGRATVGRTEPGQPVGELATRRRGHKLGRLPIGGVAHRPQYRFAGWVPGPSAFLHAPTGAHTYRRPCGGLRP